MAQELCYCITTPTSNYCLRRIKWELAKYSKRRNLDIQITFLISSRSAKLKVRIKIMIILVNCWTSWNWNSFEITQIRLDAVQVQMQIASSAFWLLHKQNADHGPACGQESAFGSKWVGMRIMDPCLAPQWVISKHESSGSAFGTLACWIQMQIKGLIRAS